MNIPILKTPMLTLRDYIRASMPGHNIPLDEEEVRRQQAKSGNNNQLELNSIAGNLNILAPVAQISSVAITVSSQKYQVDGPNSPQLSFRGPASNSSLSRYYE